MLKFITALLFALCITTSYTQALSGEFVFQYEDEIYFPETEVVASSASDYEEPSDDCMELVSKAMNLKTNELRDMEDDLMVVVNVDTQDIEGETVISAYTVLDDSDEEGEIIVHVDASFVSEDVEGETVISTFVDIDINIEEESDDDDGEIVVTVDARFMNEEIEGETVISTFVSMDTDEEEDDDLMIVVNVDASEIEGETVVSAYTLPEDNDEEGEIIVHVDASFMKTDVVEDDNNSHNVDLLDS